MKNKRTPGLIGSIVDLEITEYRKEEDPSFLAVLMAEHLHKSSQHQKDSGSMYTASASERQKGVQLQNIIFQLEERMRMKAPPKPSRMDPLNTYNLEDCRKELLEVKTRAQEFQEIANEHTIEAERHRIESSRLHKKILKLRKAVK